MADLKIDQLPSAPGSLVGTDLAMTSAASGSAGYTYTRDWDQIKAFVKAAFTASEVANVPAGNISATNVQAAINELDTEKLDKTGGNMTGQLAVNVSTGTAIAASQSTSGTDQTDAIQVLQSTDAGADGPTQALWHNSPSPAANDLIRQLYIFNDSLGNPFAGVSINARLDDPTDGSEDTSLLFSTVTAGGALTAQAKIGNGIAANSLTYQGVNTINFSDIFDDNVNINLIYAALAGASFTGQVGLPLGSVGAPALGVGGVLTNGFYSPTTSTFFWATGGVDRIGFSNSVFRIGVPGTQVTMGSAGNPSLAVHGTSNSGSAIGFGRWSADGNAPAFYLGKSRSTTIGTFGGSVLNGDVLGSLNVMGDDGTAFAQGGGYRYIASENWSGTARGLNFNMTLNMPTTTTGYNALWVYGGGGLAMGALGNMGFNSVNADRYFQNGIALNSMTTVATDAAFTLQIRVSSYTIRHTGTLTNNRLVTLSTTNAVAGDEFFITRTGSGAFNLDIGGLKNLVTNTWCRVTYDGSAWYLSAYGAL